MARARLMAIAALAAVAAGSCSSNNNSAPAPATAPAAAPPRLEPVAVEGHPRLWLTAADLPRLRERAKRPIFSRGLEPLARDMKASMDAGEADNEQCVDGGFRTCESYAMLFAFMSLVHPSEEERADFARRARTMLMTVLDEVAKGPLEGHPLRNARFSITDRSRWSGEAFALAVDWIYPHLTAEDKATIRRVFLRWCAEQLDASVTNHNHPVPRGVTNDPELVADRKRVRWAGNNYYTAHMRNLGLMAMALDPADDRDGELRAYLDNATGAWLYVVDHLLRNDARGGLGPEGLQYQQQTLSYVAQFLLALETAGLADPDRLGPQVVMADNRFWRDSVTAYFHLLSPARVKRDWRGLGHDLAWYGDGQHYGPQDFVDLYAVIGIHAERTGDAQTARAVRWLQKHTPPGGAADLHSRVSRPTHPRQAILYYLLDPESEENPAADPRGELPRVFEAPGLGHIYARTGWDERATWFRYILGWIGIDHQHAEGNHFDFYRRGEWLTKKRLGYSHSNLASSQFHNTLTIENDRPHYDSPSGYRYALWQRGSQWTLGLNNSDGEILARSFAGDFLYLLGDATGLYNSDYEGSTDVAHASRSLVWLEPDHIVIYDRAESRTEGRHKRFWLQLPRPAKIAGGRATMTTEAGQRLHVTRLLPERAAMRSGAAEPLEGEVARGEPMQAYLVIAPEPPPRRVRFLTVVQGADPGVDADPATLVRSDRRALEGAAVGNTLVLFPVELGAELTGAGFSVPEGVERVLVTGLAAGESYAVTRAKDRVDLGKGEGARADSGGVLVISMK